MFQIFLHNTLCAITTLLTSTPTPANAVADKTTNAAKDWELMKTLPIDDLISQIASRIVHFAIQLTIAVVVFYIGKFLIKKIQGILRNIFLRRKVDASLSTFLLSFAQIVCYFILIVTVIGIMGIETSSFIAIFASAGVAIGMALSGTLQNFAGGVLILLLKPYKVGDYIETQGYAGTVREIQIFSTIINTYDNKSIILPNGGLSTGSINNWSREDYRRVEWPVSISYGDSFENASAAILEILNAEPLIVKQFIEDDRIMRRQAEKELNGISEDETEGCDPDTDPDCTPEKHGRIWRLFHHRRTQIAQKIEQKRKERQVVLPKVDRSPVVVLDQMGASSVDLKARAWVQSVNYWKVYYDINNKLYSQLPLKGVNFPFPQLDVHLTQASPADK